MLIPVFALGTIGMGLALALAAFAASPGSGLPHPGIVGEWLLIIAAHSVAGFALGRAVPIVVAVPVSLLVSFVVLAYPSAMEPLWMRHLVGSGLRSCCTVAEVPDGRAIGAGCVVALAILVAALVLGSRAHRVVAAVAAGVLVLTGIGVGSWLAKPLDVRASTARPTNDLKCSGEQPQICLWPELSGQSEDIRRTVRSVRDRLMGVGLDIPGTITTAERAQNGELSLGLEVGSTPEQMTMAFTGALLPDGPPACANSQQQPGAAAYGPVSAWLDMTAGLKVTDRDGRYSPEDVAVARKVRDSPKSAQLAWYKHNRQALSDCTTEPVVSAAHKVDAGATR
ncbi:DUF7224 domain-containing protein [Streptomyces chattanoogensis]|nr:hypothetical protein [Streptomyces chattanoogensis]